MNKENSPLGIKKHVSQHASKKLNKTTSIEPAQDPTLQENTILLGNKNVSKAVYDKIL